MHQTHFWRSLNASNSRLPFSGGQRRLDASTRGVRAPCTLGVVRNSNQAARLGRVPPTRPVELSPGYISRSPRLHLQHALLGARAASWHHRITSWGDLVHRRYDTCHCIRIVSGMCSDLRPNAFEKDVCWFFNCINRLLLPPKS